MSVRRRAVLCAELVCLISLGASHVLAQAENPSVHRRDMVAPVPVRSSVRGQQPRRSTDRRITLDLRDVELKEALRAIAAQGDIVLLYNDRDIPAEPRVSVSVTDVTVIAALRLMLRGTGLTARETGAGIVIERRVASAPRRRAREQEGSIRGTVTDVATHTPVAGATVAVNDGNLETVTGADGLYRLAKVPVGTVTLAVRRLGYGAVSRRVTVTADSETVVDVALAAATTVLDQVVVTGTVVPTEVKALPSPISVIKGDAIVKQHASTIGDAIRLTVPSAVAFNTPNNSGATQISARGASSLIGAGNMKIFVDGVEATYFAFSAVDPASIDRIEIVRGPQAATIYGADAAGGVIQIFTKHGDSALDRPQADLRAMLGVTQTPYAGFGTVPRQQYTGSVRGGAQDMSYNFGGGYTHLGDYLPNGELSAVSTSSVYGGMHVARGIVAADVSARYYGNESPPALNPLMLATGYTPMSRPLYTKSNGVNETVGARLSVSPTRWWRHQLTVGVDRFTTQNAQTQPRRTTAADTLLSLSDYLSRKLSVAYSTSVSRAISEALGASLTIGIDHYAQSANSIFTSHALNTDGSIHTSPPGGLSESITSATNTGYFAQALLSAHDALFFTAGVRAEDNSSFGSDYGTAVLPRFGMSLVRQLGSATIKLRGSYGQALRAPTIGQATGSVSPTSIVLPNPQLAAEQQQGWDGGVDVAFGSRASLSVSGYDQVARDLISFIQVASKPVPTYQYQNAGRVSNRGVEVEGTLEPAIWMQLTAQYGYVRSRFEAVGATGGAIQVGDEPLGVPAHTAGMTVTLTPRGGTSLTAGATYMGSYRQNDFLAEYRCFASFTAAACPASFLSTGSTRVFAVDYPGLTKVNLTVTQRLTRQFEAFLSVDNLTNSDAYEGRNTAPVVGRTTMAGAHVTF